MAKELIPFSIFGQKRFRYFAYLFFVVLFGLVSWQSYIEIDSLYFGVRQPYLQAMAVDGVTIRWRSQERGIGWVRYGGAPESLVNEIRGESRSRDHLLRLENLENDTRYYYGVGVDDDLLEGGSKDFWFRTLPVADSSRPVRVWAVGDIGHIPEGALRVRAGAWSWLQQNIRPGRELIDAWITLGDNSGHTGTGAEFQYHFFDLFPDILRNFAVWPVYGNHDGRRRAYQKVFSTPQFGESGGLASKSERYYSFDIGPVHFIAIDTQVSFRRGTQRMLDWIEADLGNNQLPWTIAYWHHPPYTKASHDSDAPRDSRGRMFWVREKILPLIEAGGVDLVLSGHSHSYERSYLLAGHYGTSNTLTSEMVLSRVDGSEAGSGAYTKPVVGYPQNFGTVYIVCGSSSKVNPGQFDHPVMQVGIEKTGSLVLDIGIGRLEGRLIGEDGVVLDDFTIIKNL